MKIQFHPLAIATLLLSCGIAHTLRAAEPPAQARERIGVYDSRSVAIAYASSPYLKRELQALTSKHKKAKESGDEKEAARLQAQGEVLQARLNRQGFSTNSVDDLLAHIPKALPKIREVTGVSIIVSKWDKAELAKHPKAERVNVTVALVDAFEPNERAPARPRNSEDGACPAQPTQQPALNTKQDHHMKPSTILSLILGVCALPLSSTLRADETCSSPYLARIEGQEEYLYVWTLGVAGVGDGSDKLVTVNVDPRSRDYGKVIHSTSLGGRFEAHHGGFTDDRRQLWLCGLDGSKIFIFDVHLHPESPRLVKTIDNFEQVTGGAAGPHGAYALPGRVLVPCLSNAKDKGGQTALTEFGNDGNYIATHWMPTKNEPRGVAGAEFADGYGYDARVLPRKNVMLSTSFTGWKNYTRPFGELVKDADAMKNFGGSMVLWNFHTRQPKKAFNVPGAPLEIRWAWGEKRNYAFTATALTSKLWLCYEDKDGEWQAKEVATVGGAGGVLPVDISLSADDQTLFVDCFGDGKCRVFDVSNPHQPKQIYEKQIGRQLNMASQSWDGKRLYFSSSLLANWDKTGSDNEQFVKGYAWNGKELTPKFALDFNALKLGRPHHMLFGAGTVRKGDWMQLK